MSEQIKAFVRKTKPQFLKYKKYLLANDWTNVNYESSLDDEYFNNLYSNDKSKVKKAEVQKIIKEQIAAQKNSIKYKSDEFQLQNSLMLGIVDRLKYFVNKNQSDHHLKDFKTFVKDCLNIIKIHTDRVDEYVNSVDISKIENQEVRGEEIKLIKDCFSGITKIQDEITKLNIKDDSSATDGIQWLATQKATLAMHKSLSLQYPEINKKLAELKIDFDSEPPQTLHILNENPPLYNPEKNYWEQDNLQYWVDEYKKIDRGVTIDGYYFDGWLYFHFNHFVTKVPTTVLKGGIEENDDKIQVPDLRDNEVLINNYFIKSKKEQLMSLIAATRRAAKTTMNASRISRAKILGRMQILCAGGSAEDLGHIHANMDVCDENITPAFKLYYLSPTEDGRGSEYGIKTVSNKSKVTSRVYIINLEGGTSKKKKETLAGFTPDEFILDEAMKFPFKSQLEALEPALWGIGVLRCNVLITGTGGDEDLAVDAIRMLNDPKGNRVCLMDWDELDRHCPVEHRTWTKKPFGLFLPTQMCIKHPKKESNLAEYLGIESEYLSKVRIWITDWEAAKEREQEERDNKISSKKSYTRLLAYHPFSPDEIFLSGKESPFPIAEAKAHRDYLLQTGLWDRRRDLYRDSTGKIVVQLSTKELAPFPYNGSNIDAPFLIFEDPPKEKVKWGTYTAGFDDYKQDEAAEGSLGTFIVWKNESIGDPFSKKIVATLACRPNKHTSMHEKWLLLCEAYQLEGTVFGENEDMKFKDFLDIRHLTEKYLATSLDFTQTFNLPNALKRKFGWTPQSSKRTLFNLFVDYCNEEFTVEEEDGKILTLKGVQKIDDIWLLEEIIQYTDNQNVDRLIGAIGGFGFCHYLISSYRWKVQESQKQVKEGKYQVKKAERQKQFYTSSGRSRNFYRGR